MNEHDAPSDQLPVTHRVDLCVVGGTLAGVAAARAAAQAGASVLLLAAPPYLGEDLTATFRHDPDLSPREEIARALFAEDGTRRPTPMQAKRALEDAMSAAGADFLYGCHAVAVARSAQGRIAGVVAASRSGRFVIAAAAVVDATVRATLARAAGVDFTAYPAGPRRFERVVIGGAVQHGEGIVAVHTDTEPVRVHGKDGEQQDFALHRYQLEIGMPDGGPDAFAAAELHAARVTFDPDQQRASDRLWQLPPDPMAPGAAHCAQATGDLPVAACATSEAGLWIAGACADCSRAVANEALRPVNALHWGAELGTAIASEVPDDAPEPQRVKHRDDERLSGGRLRSEQQLRWEDHDRVAVDPRTVPVLDAVDVLVMGGGTAGASAAIGAARQGARTLVVECQAQLGGVGTVGMIANYYFGNRVGFTAEMDRGVALLAGGDGSGNIHRWRIECKQQWYRDQIAAAGGRIWTSSIGYGVWVEDGVVRGVLVATPEGAGLVTAKAVVDSSGNADVAAHAGAETERVDGDSVAIQGAGLGPRDPGYEYRNTDWTFADCDDVVDTTAAMVVARRKYADAFDVAGLVDTRERRRVIGERSLGPLDFLAERTFRDTVVTAHSNFDTHGFTIHPLFMALPPDKTPMDAHVPLRCLLPRDVRGVTVTGLGKCAHRDALPVVRMQPDVQNEGYAMGVAGAWAAGRGCDVRELGIRELQRHLVETAILDPAVLAHEDSPPPSDTELRAVIDAGLGDHLSLAMVFAEPERARPFLRSALTQAQDRDRRLHLATVLGLLGDAAGAEVLAAAIAESDWDAGWNYKGMGQFGASISPLDARIIALGRSGSAQHAGVVLDKLAALTPEHDMSHSRAIGEAVEALGLREAATGLAALLRSEGVGGHHHHDPMAVAANVDPSTTDNTPRNRSLRELHLARALYLVGDHEDLGRRTLERYARDLRGPYARHARAVLAGGRPVGEGMLSGAGA